jgi:hypothetical protein
MAVTLKEIKGWLDSKGLSYFDAEQHDSAVHLHMSSGDFKGYMKIELEEDGKLIQFYYNQIIEDATLKVKDHKHQLLVLQYLLDRNYQTKFGTWELDPEDGEIRFAVEIPLEDATMTTSQFNKIFDRVVNTNENFVAINKIMETGEYPSEDSIDDMFASMMASMIAESFMEDLEKHDGDLDAMLEDIQLQLKSDKKDDTEDGI